MKRGKKAVFFSIDALIALIIVLLSILIIFPAVKTPYKESFIPGDIINTLTSLKIGEIDDPVVAQLISGGDIVDLDKTVLEQIGEFYVTDLSIAEDIAESILNNLDTTENVGIWYGDSEPRTLIASKNSTPFENAKNVEIDRQIISGISSVDGSVTGYSARAYLLGSSQKKYFYFGGYVGDGEISVNITYNGVLEDVDLEIVANTRFRVCIEGGFCVGSFEPAGSVFEPKKFDNVNLGLVSGSNIVKFIPENLEEELYIAGGYIKITYTDSGLYEESKKYDFPGIEGIVNLYDGFYTPNEISSMNAKLFFNTAYTLFLTIGDTEVFNSEGLATEVDHEITLDNAYFSGLLNYADISEKTVPIRFGTLAEDIVGGVGVDIDVFSVTDLSGSMCECSQIGIFGICRYNENRCGSHWSCSTGVCTGGIIEARNANKAFIDAILLDNEESRVGLVGYESDVEDSNTHTLSEDSISLKAKVDEWVASGSTCICCGINRAVDDLISDSSSEKYRSMVIMSDGEATIECVEQGVTPDLNGNGQVDDAGDDAIQAACDAYNNGNDDSIIVYAVGFGGSADVTTLQAIANCGNGNYYDGSDIDDIISIYEDIAEDIIEAAYEEQTIDVTGEYITSYLYPESYIEFDYVEDEVPLGLIVTSEKQFDDANSGSFFVPNDAEVLRTTVISYSGPRWTDEVLVNGISIYDLSGFGNDYTVLGDPYAIDVPNDVVLKGVDNSVSLTTATSPSTPEAGSEFNKIIYTIKQDVSSYSDILASAEGCNWSIDFEDGASIDRLGIPDSYIGGEDCYYKSGNFAPPDNNDAIQEAVYNLLDLLDLDDNGRVDVKFTEQDLDITSSEITGIPYDWSTEVQVRRWD